MDGPQPEDFLKHHAALALEHVKLGNSSMAGALLLRIEEYLSLHGDVPNEALASLHLSHTEHMVLIGSSNKAYVV
jgi:hypothetical protein